MAATAISNRHIAAAAGEARLSALLLAGTVSLLALPSAILALSKLNPISLELPAAQEAEGGFIPAQVDPRLARSISVRTLSRGPIFQFTPAVAPNRIDRPVTVGVRVFPGSNQALVVRGVRGQTLSEPAEIRIADSAYSLGSARPARRPNPSVVIRDGGEMPDLKSFVPSPGAREDPSRFSARGSVGDTMRTGRSPRTFEDGEQRVDVGGSYRLTGNLNVTAGVRYQQDRDRLAPLSEGRKDNQAVYVGTQFKF